MFIEDIFDIKFNIYQIHDKVPEDRGTLIIIVYYFGDVF